MKIFLIQPVVRSSWDRDDPFGELIIADSKEEAIEMHSLSDMDLDVFEIGTANEDQKKGKIIDY